VNEGENSPTDSCANKCFGCGTWRVRENKRCKTERKTKTQTMHNEFVNKKAKTVWKVKTQKRKRQNAARMMRIRGSTQKGKFRFGDPTPGKSNRLTENSRPNDPGPIRF